MPDVLLFGATGYTGKLTAHALARRGADFAIAGRSREKLDRLAAASGGPEVRVAEVGDSASLVRALDDVRVLITCVGPFVELGSTAVEAGLEAGVHYVDSTGEGTFIGDLIATRDERARQRGIAMAPAMGFDEVPADVAATLATEGMSNASLVLTYAVPTHASAGTLRTSLGILLSKGPWLEDGRRKMIRAGDETRWAPMPPPLGPRLGVSFPLAEGHLAPLHLDLQTLKLFMTIGSMQRIGLKGLLPALRVVRATPARALLDKIVERAPEGPDEVTRSRSRWTILAEARADDDWRNVALSGVDPYGLTAEVLAAAALKMAQPGYDISGVVSPVEAVGVDVLQKELIDFGVSIDHFER